MKTQRTQLNLQMPPELMQQLRSAAKQTTQTMTGFVKQAIRKKLRNEDVSNLIALRNRWISNRDGQVPLSGEWMRIQDGVYALDEAIETLKKGEVVRLYRFQNGGI